MIYSKIKMYEYNCTQVIQRRWYNCIKKNHNDNNNNGTETLIRMYQCQGTKKYRASMPVIEPQEENSKNTTGQTDRTEIPILRYQCSGTRKTK